MFTSEAEQRMRVRRGGVGSGPGRVLIQAAIGCLVVAGCAADPSPALLSLVDPARLALYNSDLLDDTAKAAIRSYLGRQADAMWSDVEDPDLDRLVGSCHARTAVLDRTVLPGPGRTAVVLVEVPDTGFAEFRLTRLHDRPGELPTYTGQTRRGGMSILMIGDSVVTGRITTRRGDFDFESGPFGLVRLVAADTARTRRPLHLLGWRSGGLVSRAHASVVPALEGSRC